MIKKICLYATIVVFLFLSIQYQLYSKDRQLFHIHQIPRGKLTIVQQIISDRQIVKKIYEQTGIQLSFTQISRQELRNRQISFSLAIQGSYIFKEQSSNFITILQSLGQIKAHGDSFYKIRDRHQITCNQQNIQSIKAKKDTILITGNFIDCKNSQYEVKITKSSQNKIQINMNLLGNSYNRIIVYFQYRKEQNYFGLGEQFSYLNLGHNRPYSLFVREKGVGRTDQPETFVLNLMYGAGKSYYNSYSPTPIWISSYLKDSQQNSNLKIPLHTGYILLSYAYSIWMNNQIYIWDTTFIIEIHIKSSIKQLLKNISQVNGYTPPVPDWVNQGAIVGLQGGTQSVTKKYQILKQTGTKISGLWLQDWVSKRKSLGFSRLWWNWELDKNHYSNWDSMREKLSENNVNLLIYINPMLTSVAGKKPNYTTDYYKLAKQQQCFIKTKSGQVYQTSAFSDWRASIFDFHNNQKAQNFYKEILLNALKQTGAKGLMVDFGQAYPVQNMNNTLQEVVKLHNEYPTLYHKAVRQILDKFRDKNIDIYTFSRAGYLYTPKYTLSLWAGDQSMNFKKHSGLPSCLTAMLSSSLVGYSNTHCDIGGYSSYELPFQKTSVRTKILMTRWMQLAAFSPVFRTHEGNQPQNSLQVYSNKQIAIQFAFYSQVYSVLSSYRKQQGNQAYKNKLPLIRPFFIQNQYNEQAYKIIDQFYLGQQLLVSPILTQKNNRQIYIPKGDWINVWNNNKVQGCDCYIQHKQFLPSALIKANSKYRELISQKIQNILKKYENKIAYLNKPTKKNEDL